MSGRRRSLAASPPPSQQQAGHAYFYEDEVYRVGSRGRVRFGLVLDNCDGSSSDQSDDPGADPPLRRGDLRIVWHPSGREKIVSERTVGLADRALMPGDVVRRMIKGKDTQRGYCRDIAVTGAVRPVGAGSDLVLPAVPSERLQPLEDFTADLAVCLDSWVGTSKVVHSKLRLSSADGSTFEFPDANSCTLRDASRRRGRGPNQDSGRSEHYATDEFYPGQTVMGPLAALDGAVWTNITKEMEAARKTRMREQKFVVESIETESVGVHWQCRALGEHVGEGLPQQPRFLVEGEDLKRLKLLNLFEPCTLQVGAKNFLTLTAEDTFCTVAHWKRTQNELYRQPRRRARPIRTESHDEAEADGGTFRPPAKPKKRPSSHGREGKYPLRARASHDGDAPEDPADGKRREFDQKMDVDIVIVDSAAEPIREAQDETAKTAAPPPTDDGGARPESAEDTRRSKFILPDHSYTSDCTDVSEKQRKLRKSRICSNRSRSSSPAVFNGEHKTEPRAEHEDSGSWENTSSDEGTDTDSCATWSSQCSSSTNNSGRGKKSPHLVTKFLKGKRLKRTLKQKPSGPPPKPGDRIVVETLCTKSKANVIWQDGTIEIGIPSTELYPIHHLDGQECFPGDFVISGGMSEAQPSHRDYGVVQKVDHYGRTAIVKWFRTYTSFQEPTPQFVSESEVSVYDLKDHPDFQYRPGTVVIRVANFTGSESTCTAGQVIDNFPSGRVHVWWVDGHTSMCWPQDLYKVGEYDSDEGDIWGEEGSSSDDSWETQSSTDSVPESKDKRDTGKRDDLLDGGILLPDIDMESTQKPARTSKELPKVPRGLEPRAAVHIERGLNAMARIEEILSQNPSLQSTDIMRRLLTLYKDCRFLDRLMGTSFFHEDNFQGLIERVREHGGNRDNSTSNASVRRVHNQLMRLFSRDESDGPEPLGAEQKTASKNLTPQVEINSASKELIKENPHLMETDEAIACKITQDSPDKVAIQIIDRNSTVASTAPETDCNLKEPPQDVCLISPSSEDSLSKYNTPDGSIGDLTNQNDKSPNCVVDKSKNEDSGIDSQSFSLSQSTNNAAVVSYSSDEGNKPYEPPNKSGEGNSKVNSAGSSSNQLSRNSCLRLCSLLTIQLMKACTEVSRRRNSLYVPFLNTLMKEKLATGDSLPYRFSVQFDALVVTMTDDKDEATEGDDNTAENPSNDAELPAAVEECEMKDESKEPPKPAVPGELGEGYSVLEATPSTHRFRLSLLQPSEPRAFHQALIREVRLLKSDLPAGVWVRGYEDRMDLLSIMIAGPAKTPYEDGLFLFDVQLGGEYPRAPPLCHYISYCSDRLNPNLYEDGKVCVSLLGTWSGRGVEVWGRDSSLLQVIVSLQGLILCAEPYFNEAGFEKQKGSQQGRENSRMYNEMVLLKLVQSLTKLILHPPDIFKAEIFAHQSRHADGLCERLTKWMVMSEEHNKRHPETPLTPDTILDDVTKHGLQAPEYPLIPASKGFCLTLRSSLQAYRNALSKAGITLEKL